MAMQLEKSGGVAIVRGGREGSAAEKPKYHDELGLCLALILLLAWALFLGLHTLDWAAVTHAVKVFLGVLV
jgi:hypothetical protein